MNKRDNLTKILAVTGTALLSLPLAAPILFAGLRLLQSGRFNLDYLMPAELSPVAALGGGLLLWSVLRARARRALIGGSLVAAVVLLFGSQGLAVVIGLANGETEPVGWSWVLVLGALGLYAVALAVGVVGGCLLLRDLFARTSAPASRPPAAPLGRSA